MFKITHKTRTTKIATARLAAEYLLARAKDGAEFEVNGIPWICLGEDDLTEFKVSPRGPKGDFDTDWDFVALDDVEDYLGG